MSKRQAFTLDETIPGEDIADEMLWVLEKEFRQVFPGENFSNNVEDSIGRLCTRSAEEYIANPVHPSTWLERDGWLRK